MEKITLDAMKELLDIKLTGAAITIYAPMHPAATPPNMTEDQVRFKNLINEALHALKKQGGSKQLFDELEAFREDKLADTSFWEAQTVGLLLCASDGMMKLYQLPVDTEEYVAVNDQFHIAPILSLLNDSEEYYVLTINQHDPMLLNGDMYSVRPAGVDLPASLQAALHIDENNQKSENAQSAVGSSVNTGGWNGRGGAKSPIEEDRQKFWRIIDSIVMNNTDRSSPLILAGIDSEVAEYRHLSKYPNILSQSIGGSFQKGQERELFTKAAEIIQEQVVMKKHQAAVDEYQRLKGVNHDRVSSKQDEIEAAVEQGKVDTLLIKMTRLTTDTVRDNLNAVKRITFPEGGLSTAINELAMKVVRFSGKTINLDSQEMPEGLPMIALMRY